MPPTKRQQNNKGSNKDISQAGRNDIKCRWDVKGGDMQKKFIDKIYIKLRNIVTKYRRSNFFLREFQSVLNMLCYFSFATKCYTVQQKTTNYFVRKSFR